MTPATPLDLVMPWIEETLGRAPRLDVAWPEVSVEPRASKGSSPFVAFRTGMAVNIAVCEAWLEPVRETASAMHPDLLFSPVGCYDLSRTTLTVPAGPGQKGGTGVWGPVPSYVADADMWKTARDERVVRLTKEQFEDVDHGLFWHCARNNVLAAFGIFEQRRLVALATVVQQPGNLMEIGVDVTGDVQGRRLGSAVVSAAGEWILKHDGLIYATAALWNVPSTRNLRRLGMEYACSRLVAMPAPFRQPPQPLGSPLPGIEMMNMYPDWAMNKGIASKRPG